MNRKISDNDLVPRCLYTVTHGFLDHRLSRSEIFILLHYAPNIKNNFVEMTIMCHNEEISVLSYIDDNGKPINIVRL